MNTMIEWYQVLERFCTIVIQMQICCQSNVTMMPFFHEFLNLSLSLFQKCKVVLSRFQYGGSTLGVQNFFVCNIYSFSRTFSASQDWLFQDRRISLSKQNVPLKCSRILHRSQCEVFLRFSTFTFPLNIDWI